MQSDGMMYNWGQEVHGCLAFCVRSATWQGKPEHEARCVVLLPPPPTYFFSTTTKLLGGVVSGLQPMPRCSTERPHFPPPIPSPRCTPTATHSRRGSGVLEIMLCASGGVVFGWLGRCLQGTAKPDTENDPKCSPPLRGSGRGWKQGGGSPCMRWLADYRYRRQL